MRISLIGPGDIDYHFHQMLGISQNDLDESIKVIGKELAESGAEIVLLPDRGICFEIAKAYKEAGGEKVIGTIPLDDVDFGIKHLQKYSDTLVNGKKLFDQFINTGTWYKQDLTCSLYGDKILFLGATLGSM